ncbi:PREDICTED: WEB family protein At3g51720-like [Camelina sativa]|uniref:WEB family protein At3g51720-like n=1 Tax=Camelina sativa TaxID=90675 RepID=A0ABM0YP48_CAMSA|nr:PREDICTED: WEB family protein At3g51720-like [Camelina sativa]
MAETLEPTLVGEIDTSAPFESVREAATRFGGFGFWKPSSLNISEPSQNDVDEAGMVAKASELEKELVEKEGETLKVLKLLESTKAIVEKLKSKLQNKEDKENFDMNVFKELSQAKMDLCKTTKDLAAIRESVELLNKRLEEERAALEKTRERLNSENAAEISKEIQRLSYEAYEFCRTGENVRCAVDKAVVEIEQTRNKIEAAEMRLIAARKMKEAARAAEAVAIAEIKAVTRRRRSSRRRGNREETLQEEILETIDETAREIRSSRRTLEEGLEKANTVKMEVEEGNWRWTERRRRSSSCSAKLKNPFLMDVNGLNMMMNGDGTSSSVAVMKPTMSIGQILSRKLLLADESAMMMNGRVSLGQILGKTKLGDRNCEGKEKVKRLNGKRKRFGFANLSVMLNKESKKKKKKIALNLM